MNKFKLPTKEDNIEIESVIVKWKVRDKDGVTLSIGKDVFNTETDLGILNTVKVINFLEDVVTEETTSAVSSAIDLSNS